MSSTVTIGCRLPTGLVIDLPGQTPVTLNGQNSAQARSPIIILSQDDCGYTDVDADFWAAWKAAVGPDFQPLATQVIFEAKNAKDAAAMQAEIKDEPTGQEPVSQEDAKITAA